MNIKIRNITLPDLADIAELIKNSFSKEISSYMVQTQVGIDNYLAVGVRFPSLCENTVRYVSTINDEIIGYADWRIIGARDAFLSYICVSSEAQRMGIARSLIARFISDYPDVDRLELDVSQDNIIASTLYRKIGFRGEDAKSWLVRELPDPRPGLHVARLENSIARLDQYGFTSLEIITGKKTIEVGLLGDEVINCYTPQIFQNNDLLSKLRGAFPKRNRALMILSSKVILNKDINYIEINRSIRLSGQVSEIKSTIQQNSKY